MNAETEKSTPDDPPLSYEQARELLVEAVRQLEAGGTTLEESLELWERAERLATICEQRLAGAQERLDAALAGNGDDADGGDATPEDR